MAVLSEDWDLETGHGGTWASRGDEELNLDPNETQASSPCPMVGWGCSWGMTSPTSESCPCFNSAVVAVFQLSDTRQ